MEISMIKRVTIAYILFVASCVAAVNGDLILHWEGLSQSEVDTGELATGTSGNYHQWIDTGVENRWSIIADKGYSFPNSFIIGETTYDGTGSNWLQNNTGAGTADQYLDLRMPGNFSPTVGAFAFCGHIYITSSNATGDSVSLDLIIMYPVSGGCWTVLQLSLDPSNGNIALRAHGDDSGSTFGDDIAIDKSKVYFIRVHVSSSQVEVAVYDPATSYSLVGTSTADRCEENTYLVRFASGYIGDPAGAVQFGDIAFVFAPTTQELADMVTPQNEGTQQVKVLSGKVLVFGNSK